MAVRVLVDLPAGDLREAVLAELAGARPEPSVRVVEGGRSSLDHAWRDPVDLALTSEERASLVRAAAASAGLGGAVPHVVVVEPDASGAPRPKRQPGDPIVDGPWLPAALAVARDRRMRAAPGTTIAPGAAERIADTASSSPRIREVAAQLRRIVATDSTVLLGGATGVGKEWYAQAIHAASPRALGPFVAVNLGAVPESLVEAELFGHASGAFTGADRGRRGLFELADGGTLFLDEVGELPANLQPRLLRVLQEGRIRPLGDDREIRVDARLVAATNRDLEEEVAAGRFRRDLYYRLAVFPLRIPGLRERREDLPALAEAMLLDAARRNGRPAQFFSEAAQERLADHDWPGNVRELANVVQRAALLCDGDVVGPEHLPAHLGGKADPLDVSAVEDLAERAVRDGEPLEIARRRVDDRFESRYLEGLLTECGGRVGEVARRAGITARALYDKLRRHGLDRRRYRP